MQVPEEEKYLQNKDELMARLVTLVAGRAAEEIVFGKVTTGAANDIEKATKNSQGYDYTVWYVRQIRTYESGNS